MKNLPGILFGTFVLFLLVAVSLPESASAQCGGGLFGIRGRIQARQEARRAARYSAAGYGCSGSVTYGACAGRVEYQAPARVEVRYVPVRVEVPQASPACNCPQEQSYPSANFDQVPENFVAMETKIPLNPGW